MLKLISLDEREELVLTADPAVMFDSEAEDAPSVIRLSEAKIASKKKPTVFKVRILNSRERMQIAEASGLNHSEALFITCEKAVMEIYDGQRKAKSSQEITDYLLRIPAECVYSIAGWVLDNSSLSPDPLDKGA
jgi:hypothetical protein